MALKQSIEMYDLLDSAHVNGHAIAALFKSRGLDSIEVKRLTDDRGETDFIKIVVPGTDGKQSGGESPTLGIICHLGGIGARPKSIGLVSDADGAIVALATGLKLADMSQAGDILRGDVIITTQVCPRAPVEPHLPVPFVGSPIDSKTLLRLETDPAMDAILSLDTTRGNRVINYRGFAFSPTVKEGYILRVSDSLIDIMEAVTGSHAVILPITTQDITPYGNGVYHINSILQPATITVAPVVAVALTAQVAVAGSATGASQIADIEQTVRFCIEVAKGIGNKGVHFYDPKEFKTLVGLYGTMRHLQDANITLEDH